MCSILWIASLVFGVAILSAGTAESQSTITESVRVAIELRASAVVATREANTMIAEADAIWRPNGVSVVLSSPTEPEDTVVRLTLAVESSADRQFKLRTPARSSTKDSRDLGSIRFDEEGVRGELLLVNVDSVVTSFKQSEVYGRNF